MEVDWPLRYLLALYKRVHVLCMFKVGILEHNKNIAKAEVALGAGLRLSAPR
jgi:hypothetical protein